MPRCQLENLFPKANGITAIAAEWIKGLYSKSLQIIVDFWNKCIFVTPLKHFAAVILDAIRPKISCK